MKLARIRRYVAYDSKKETSFAATFTDVLAGTPSPEATVSRISRIPDHDGRDQVLDSQNKTIEISLTTPKNIETCLETTTTLNSMTDFHLSGSDPRLFPGILTSNRRSDDLRNLNQGDKWPIGSAEASGNEDEVWK